MTTTLATSGLALKPWARETNEQNNLADVLQRVNIERGHFRDITEASLQEELVTEGAIESSEEEEVEGDEETEEATGNHAQQRPTTREELYNARRELLEHIAQAEQDVLMSLDCISLLQTQRSINPAATTISPFLRNNVPLASLGTDAWRNVPADHAREAQDKVISMNVRMEGLQSSADSLMAAALRLKDNVKKETQYWQQIMSVSQQGWSISKIRRNDPTLGVHFGFGGSAPEFTQRNLAALIGNAEGDIALERGIGSRPKTVVATIKTNDEIIGISRLPFILDNAESTLESRIRHARDSVFDEELFHEMIREGRALSSQSISMQGMSISFSTARDKDNDQTLSFELVSLDQIHKLPATTSHEFDTLAQASLTTARLLLSQVHRERLQRKAEIPAPMTGKTEDKLVHPILRPLMLLLQHLSQLQTLNSHFTRIASLLQKIGLSVALRPFTMTIPALQTSNTDTSAESLTAILLRPIQTPASLTIATTTTTSSTNTDTPQNSSTTLDLLIESSQAYTFGALYSLTTTTNPTALSTEPSATNDAPQQSTSASNISSPLRRFTSTSDLYHAVDDALADTLTAALRQRAAEGNADDTVRRRNARKEVDVEVDGVAGRLRVRTGGIGGGEEVVWDLNDAEAEMGKEKRKLFEIAG